jgi:Co/Zn/Cd efflux system component
LGVWLNGLLFFFNVQPQAEIMGSIGALALVANLLSVAILLKYRDCDSNVRSVWLFSRNDVLAAKKIVYPLELPQIEACVNL